MLKRQQKNNGVLAVNSRSLDSNDRVERHLSSSVIKRSNVIEISFSSHDPKWSQTFLRRLIDKYLEFHSSMSHDPQAEKFFQKQADILQTRLRSASCAFVLRHHLLRSIHAARFMHSHKCLQCNFRRTAIVGSVDISRFRDRERRAARGARQSLGAHLIHCGKTGFPSRVFCNAVELCCDLP